jgi:hypothetical protein
MRSCEGVCARIFSAIQSINRTRGTERHRVATSGRNGGKWWKWWKMVVMVEKELGDPFPRFHQFDWAGNLSWRHQPMLALQRGIESGSQEVPLRDRSCGDRKDCWSSSARKTIC